MITIRKNSQLLTALLLAVGMSMGLLGVTAAAAQSATPISVPRILGGATASLEEVPYIAQVDFDDEYKCTGVLITPTWVLTARHCQIPGKRASVRLGSTNLGAGTRIPVKRSVIAPQGDLQLLELAEHSSQPVAPLLTNKTLFTGAMGNLYGWGATLDQPTSPQLRTATATYIKKGVDLYGADAYMMQAGSGQSARGDSGGPLVVDGKVAGISSFATSPELGLQSTTFYTVLYYARHWISETTGRPTP